MLSRTPLIIPTHRVKGAPPLQISGHTILRAGGGATGLRIKAILKISRVDWIAGNTRKESLRLEHGSIAGTGCANIFPIAYRIQLIAIMGIEIEFFGKTDCLDIGKPPSVARP